MYTSPVVPKWFLTKWRRLSNKACTIDNHWRFIDWATEGCYSKTLVLEDLPKIYASSAHFARKFDIDSDVNVRAEIDKAIGVRS